MQKEYKKSGCIITALFSLQLIVIAINTVEEFLVTHLLLSIVLFGQIFRLFANVSHLTSWLYFLNFLCVKTRHCPSFPSHLLPDVKFAPFLRHLKFREK